MKRNEEPQSQSAFWCFEVEAAPTTLPAFRKGVKAHQGVLEAYVKGMDVKDTDRFIVIDLIPNRLGTNQGVIL